MAWIQNGVFHTEGKYTITEHAEGNKRWCTLEYGSEYVGPSCHSLSDAKAAAAAHGSFGENPPTEKPTGDAKKPRRGSHMARDIDFDVS